MTPQKKTSRSALLPLLLFFVFLYLLTHPGPPDRGDENTLLLTAESMLYEGKLWIEPKDGRPTIVVGKDGHWYTKLGVGQPLAEIPFLAVGRTVGGFLVPDDAVLAFGRFAVGLLPVLLTVATIWMVHAFAASFGYSRGAALAVAGAFGIGTMAWPYAGSLLIEPLEMCALVMCAWGLWRWRSGASKAWLAAASFALGFAITAKVAVAVALPGVIVYAFYRMHEGGRKVRGVWPKGLVLLFAPLAVWLAVNLWYNWARFGGLVEIGYSTIDRDVEMGFGTPWYVGLYGLLLSFGKGLLLYVPVVVLGMFGAARFWRSHRREAMLFIGICVPIFVISARWHGWHGDYSWGPRYLVPLVPFLMLFSVPVWEAALAAGHRAQKAAVIVLLILSVGVQTLGVFVDSKRYPHLIHYYTSTQGVYRKGINEIRDDLLLNHFVPEFSPIVAHAWLLQYGLVATFGDDTPELRQAAADHAPWLSLDRAWTVRVGGDNGMGPGFLLLNSWYIKWQHVMRGALGVGKVLLAIGLIGTAASAAWFVLKARRRNGAWHPS